MTVDVQRLLKQRRKALYVAVGQNRPDLYRRAVDISHLSLIAFGGDDETKRAALVEGSIMSLIAEILRIQP